MKNYHRQYELSGDAPEDIERFVRYSASYINNYVNKNSKVLDVGSGDGIMQKYLKGKDVKCIDIEPANNKVIKGTIYQEPIKTYDLIIYNHVLEHIWEHYREVEQAVKCLKDGGLLFIAVPYHTAPYAYVPEPHVILFNKEILERLGQQFNMKTVDYSTHCLRHDNKEQWILFKKQ